MKRLLIGLCCALGISAWAWGDGSFVAPPSPGQIPGTTTNDNACAGCVGEFQTNAGTTVSITSGLSTGTVIASKSLTAGDWECSGNGIFNPAGTTTTTFEAIWTGTSSTLTVVPAGGLTYINRAAVNGTADMLAAAPERYSLSGTTTINLYMAAAFAVSTMTGTATIRCWRRR